VIASESTASGTPILVGPMNVTEQCPYVRAQTQVKTKK
jgi:hypothetical protein